MDPNATLKEILREFTNWDDRDEDRCLELAKALQDWLEGGGFCPDLNSLDMTGQRVLVLFATQHIRSMCE